DRPWIVWDRFSCSLRRCRIAGGVQLSLPESAYLADNIIQGPVGLGTYNGLHCVGNSIEGPGAFGISGTFRDELASIVRDTSRGFDTGIRLAGVYGTEVRDNLVEGCSQAGIMIEDGGGFSNSVTGNIVRSCGNAIHVSGAERVFLTGNVAEDCDSGIFAA